jgi:integrase
MGAIELFPTDCGCTQRIQKTGFVFSEPKSAAGRRVIVLGHSMIDCLKQHYRVQRQEIQEAGESWHDIDLIFPSTIGTPWDHRNLYREYKKLLVRAGLPDIRFHDLRHTAATLMLQQNIHPKVVQERLGYSDISLTLNTYSHVMPGLQEEAVDKIDELMDMTDVSDQLSIKINSTK